MFEELINNIERQRKIIYDLKSIHASMGIEERSFLMRNANSLLHQLRLLNLATPKLLSVWPKIQEDKKENKHEMVRVEIPQKNKDEEKKYVTLNKEDKKEYVSQLNFSKDNLSSLKKLKNPEKKVLFGREFSLYSKISSFFFKSISEKNQHKFSSLSEDLKRANIKSLLPTYLSNMFFSTALSLIVSIVCFLVLLTSGIASLAFIPGIFLIPALVLSTFYFYPSSEASSVQKEIAQELPFATIHMAAISGSEISPIKIFKIIAKSKDYPHVGSEIRKIVSRVEVYGYDLVTSLKEVATKTPNKDLSELFGGIATNISTGGSLKSYLRKKADNFLLDYKLDRQKYIDLAGTFMDIYISVLIAAPLVLMMMFIVMNVSGLGFEGLSIQALMTISIVAIVIINIIFLTIVNIKQPKV